MKNVLAGRNERSLYKLVVDGATDEIVGIHMIGPDAPEILQAAAIAVKAQAQEGRFRRHGCAPPDHGRRAGADALDLAVWAGSFARRDHHRRGPQRPDLRLLSREEGPEGRRARGRGHCRRRGGDRRIPARLPQFGGELHGQPAPAQGHPRHAARAARPEGRAAQDRQFPARRRRLSARRAATG